MIVDEHVYLDHAGVKGMKWGVRNARAPVVTTRVASRPTVNRQALIAERQRQMDAEKSARRKKAAVTALLAGGAFVAGAIIVNRLMARNQGIKANQIKDAMRVREFQANINKSHELFKASASTPLSQIRRGFAVDTKGIARPIVSTRNPFTNPLSGRLI